MGDRLHLHRFLLYSPWARDRPQSNVTSLSGKVTNVALILTLIQS